MNMLLGHSIPDLIPYWFYISGCETWLWELVVISINDEKTWWVWTAGYFAVSFDFKLTNILESVSCTAYFKLMCFLTINTILQIKINHTAVELMMLVQTDFHVKATVGCKKNIFCDPLRLLILRAPHSSQDSISKMSVLLQAIELRFSLYRIK